jgi:hypothetical protein
LVPKHFKKILVEEGDVLYRNIRDRAKNRGIEGRIAEEMASKYKEGFAVAFSRISYSEVKGGVPGMRRHVQKLREEFEKEIDADIDETLKLNKSAGNALCPKCKSSIKKDYKFCRTCGELLHKSI